MVFLVILVLYFSFYLFGVLYLAGRVYLVTESFVSVANLPEAVYELLV